MRKQTPTGARWTTQPVTCPPHNVNWAHSALLLYPHHDGGERLEEGEERPALLAGQGDGDPRGQGEHLNSTVFCLQHSGAQQN